MRHLYPSSNSAWRPGQMLSASCLAGFHMFFPCMSLGGFQISTCTQHSTVRTISSSQTVQKNRLDTTRYVNTEAYRLLNFSELAEKCVKAMHRDTRVAKQLPYIILTNNDTGVLAKYTKFWSTITDILILLLFRGRIKASPTPSVLFASATILFFLGLPTVQRNPLKWLECILPAAITLNLSMNSVR